jgi:hypothetical protein
MQGIFVTQPMLEIEYCIYSHENIQPDFIKNIYQNLIKFVWIMGHSRIKSDQTFDQT